MLRIDLHLHSTFSDGLLTPQELVRKLKIARVSVAALTDHDSIAGTRIFADAAREAGIATTPGVELSSDYEGVLHVLGYRLDTGSGALKLTLEKNRASRHERNLSICRRLRELGLEITFEEAAALAGSDVVGRPHIARVLVHKKYVPNVRAAFDLYLGRGKRAYVHRELPSPEECVGIVRQARGLPVMAHPLQTTPDLDDLPPILQALKDAGLWGLECWTPGNGTAETAQCLEYAARYGLYPTAGSDFHGKEHASSSVGIRVSEDLLPWARFCGGL